MLLNNLKILKNTEFKILPINPGVVAAIHVAGVRGDPCGAVRCDCRGLLQWVCDSVSCRVSMICSRIVSAEVLG